MDLPLKHPITIGKVTISKLVFRDYTTGGDYLAFDRRGGVSQRHALIANLAGVDEEVVRLLRGPDYRAAADMADKLIEEDEKANKQPEEAEKKLPES